MTNEQKGGRRLLAAALTLALLATIGCGGPADSAADRRARSGIAGNYEVEADPVNTNRIELFYVCGNEFNVRNANPLSLLVRWKVQNSSDEGTVVLPAASGGAKGQTNFVTNAVGTVYLYYGNTNIRRYANQQKPCASPPPPPPPPPPAPPPIAPSPTASGMGQWSAVLSLPLVAMHNTVMPDGRLLLWSIMEDAAVWDFRNNAFTAVPGPSLLFCATQTLLPDGRILVAGGHISNDHGLRDVNLFEPSTMKWTRGTPMRAGRWYPSVLNMPGGEVLVIGGATETGVPNLIPEMRRTDGSWFELTGAAETMLQYYPFVFLAPDRRVFMAGPGPKTKFLDTSGTGRWTPGPTTATGLLRRQGMGVAYEPGKVMIIGGGLTPTNTVETIDLNVPGAKFQQTSSMSFARRHHNASILPDGRVLVTGGTSASGDNNFSGAVLTPELWDPANGLWTKLAPMKIARQYHSTAVLLPDGRVLTAGNNSRDRTAEIYSPPYLFNADGTPAVRPSIAAAPQQIAYDQSFDVETPDAGRIASVTLIGLPATTHGKNFNQRFLRLPFTTGAGRITVKAPVDAALAPPSLYYLFILDGKGVPSAARVVALQ
jgi:galactose oxidase